MGELVGESKEYSESLEDRYNIYVQLMIDTGAYVKSFDEWLNS